MRGVCAGTTWKRPDRDRLPGCLGRKWKQRERNSVEGVKLCLESKLRMLQRAALRDWVKKISVK